MNKYIESDLYQLTGEISLKAAIREYFKSSTFRWQVAYRLHDPLEFQSWQDVSCGKSIETGRVFKFHANVKLGMVCISGTEALSS